eukprot:5183352-Pleurochrysis_carterae.AAC.1
MHLSPSPRLALARAVSLRAPHVCEHVTVSVPSCRVQPRRSGRHARAPRARVGGGRLPRQARSHHHRHGLCHQLDPHPGAPRGRLPSPA